MKIIDLFSGVGSFGLECISRGASKVYFFENYKQSVDILLKNISSIGIGISKMAFSVSFFSS